MKPDRPTDEADESTRILLVEDDAGGARWVREALGEQGGFEVIRARRLSSALRHLRGPGFDLVLLGLALPDCQGIEAVLRTRPACGHLPIVTLHDRDDDRVAIEALRAGAQDCLIKGQIDGRALVRTIRHAVERQRMMLDLERARAREHFLATHDSLTGLPNRPQFYECLGRALSRSERQDRMLAVLFVDLDHFKPINDTHGHGIGDVILRCAGERLRASTRTSDTVARLGGDEFVVLIERLARPDDAERVAEEILRRLSAPFALDRQELRLTASLGLALFPQDGADPEVLVRNADAAMYLAKAAGRNTYRFYSDALNSRARRPEGIEGRLAEALTGGQFVLHYQPLVETTSGRIVAAEALLRWSHPELGLLFPADFIPAAERTEWIGPIGDWVLRRACEQHRAWRRAGFSDLRMAVNLSSVQLRSPDLPDRVARVLVETRMGPDQLELEIKESGMAGGRTRVGRTLRELAQLGVRISVDDFGTGTTPVSSMRSFPTSTLKIDRDLVRQLPEDDGLSAAIIGLADGLDLEVVAEGVETVEQMACLLSRNCHLAQGFLFSGPVPADEFLDLLRAGSLLPEGLPDWEVRSRPAGNGRNAGLTRSA